MQTPGYGYSPSLLSIRKLNNTGHNSETAMLENQRLLLRLIDRPSVISRKNLALQSGLKQATITNIVNYFLQHNIVWETDLMPKEPGSRRRMRGIQITNRFYVISVRINICFLSVGAYDMRRKNLYYHREYLDTLRDHMHTCDLIQEQVAKIRALLDGAEMQPLGVGVGVEGPFIIRDDRYLFYTPDQTFFDFTEELRRRVDLPVLLNRSSNLAAYVLWQMLWGEDLGVAVAITVSYCLDCGILVNGEILNGSQGMAGRLHDMVGERLPDGSYRTYKDLASVKALLNNVQAHLSEYPDSVLQRVPKPIAVADVIRAYDAGDPLALRVYDECAIFLGRAVNTILSILNPNVIFLCDDIPHSPRFLSRVYEEATRDIYSDFDVSQSAAGLDRSHLVDSRTKSGITFHLVVPDDFPGEAEDPVLLGAANYVILSSIECGYFLDLAVGEAGTP